MRLSNKFLFLLAMIMWALLLAFLAFDPEGFDKMPTNQMILYSMVTIIMLMWSKEND